THTRTERERRTYLAAWLTCASHKTDSTTGSEHIQTQRLTLSATFTNTLSLTLWLSLTHHRRLHTYQRNALTDTHTQACQGTHTCTHTLFYEHTYINTFFISLFLSYPHTHTRPE